MGRGRRLGRLLLGAGPQKEACFAILRLLTIDFAPVDRPHIETITGYGSVQAPVTESRSCSRL
jgi:hypothetical protein